MSTSEARSATQIQRPISRGTVQRWTVSVADDPSGPFSRLVISGKILCKKNLFPGAVMKQSKSGTLPSVRPLNAVALRSAVLCAECDVVSDSPHDVCMVCGSHSLVNICRILGGNLPKTRAELVQQEPLEITREILLQFPRPHRVRRRLSV
jgi:hypothetical protein